jgi:hypothetical protein
MIQGVEMGTNQLRVVGTGLFFVFIFLSGYWLSRSGKPYSAIIFNIHKLIGLAAGVFLIVTVYQIHRVAPLGPAEIIAIVVTVLFFIGVVAAGGLLSIDKPMPVIVSMMHKLLPYVAVLSTAVTLYLLLSRKS